MEKEMKDTATITRVRGLVTNKTIQLDVRIPLITINWIVMPYEKNNCWNESRIKRKINHF